MKIIPIASDSMGTRSMATFVETDDCKILIDPGVALGPRRYGLPPHPLEIEKLEEDWRNIVKYADKAQVMIVTHYHYDHHNPEYPEIYTDKVVYLKHPTEKINYSQKKRAKYFLSKLNNLPEVIEYCDGQKFIFNSTKIKFSSPVCHGTNARLGYVVEVSISYREEKFLFTSDVEGPSLKEQVDFILKENPDILYLDGPMTYMLGYRYSAKSLEESVKNLIKILRETKIKKLIIDHHFLRDLNWRERIKEALDIANSKIVTAAEYTGRENLMLEARRKELYEKWR